MLNFRFTGRASDLPQPVSKPAAAEDLGGMYERVFKFNPNQARCESVDGTTTGSFCPTGAAAGEGGKAGGKAGGKKNYPSIPPVSDVQSRMSDKVDLAEAYGASVSPTTPKTEDEILAENLGNPEHRAMYDKHKKQVDADMADGKETWKLHAAEPSTDPDKVVYNAKRQEENEAYVQERIAEALERAKPKDGARPTFTNLAGRGGSGKSKMAKDPNNPESVGIYIKGDNLVVDADVIKMDRMAMDGRPGQGHLAPLYHEESSRIAEMLLAEARKQGLNVVYDATMKSDKPKIPQEFKDANYRTVMAMVSVPAEESAGRALGRYVDGNKGDKTGRLVPPKIVLGNTNNEANFDKEVARGHDEWYLFDNRGGDKNTQPRLVANHRGEGELGSLVKKRKVDNLDDSGIIREKGVISMSVKLERSEQERMDDCYDYPDMPSGEGVTDEVLFRLLRNSKLPPEKVRPTTSDAGFADRYRAWLSDNPS